MNQCATNFRNQCAIAFFPLVSITHATLILKMSSRNQVFLTYLVKLIVLVLLQYPSQTYPREQKRRG